MRIVTILIIIFVVLGLLILGFLNRENANKNITTHATIESPLKNTYASQSDNQANVTVDITPKELDTGKAQNIFEVSLNTHSVEMDYDFSKVIILKDDRGNSYQAVEWTGGRGGHHVSGYILFPAINLQAEEVELSILGVGGVDRVFKWTIL